MAQTQTIGTHKTRVYNEDGFTKVKYHYTTVIKFNDSEIVLNSGGWQTNTTKARINQTANQYNLNISVYQEAFKWFVTLPNGEVIPFNDGMIIKRD